jgi:VCBS repeat protein/flagellar hook capping protein FlgD
LNGDGHSDLALVTHSGIVVLYGRGDATFEPTENVSALRPPFALHMADLDGDGKPELVFPDLAPVLHVLWQGGQGSFAESTYATPGTFEDDVAFGDFNQDGLLDVATPDRSPFENGWGISVFFGNRSRALAPATVYGLAFDPSSLVAGDLDGNGSPDLLVGDEKHATLLLNRGDGSFGRAPVSRGMDDNVGRVTLANLDQDGRLDFIAPYNLAQPDGQWAFSLLVGQGQGGGRFTVADTLRMETIWMMAAADLNHDDRADLLTCDDGVNVFLSQAPSVATGASRSGLLFEVPHPNPALHTVAFAFALPEDATARLAVFDVAGRLVAKLVDGHLSAGTHRVTWDMRARNGRTVDAGVYFARLHVGSRQIDRRVEVLP